MIYNFFAQNSGDDIGGALWCLVNRGAERDPEKNVLAINARLYIS